MADTRPPSWPMSWTMSSAGPGEDDLVVDPRHLLDLAHAPEQVVVGSGSQSRKRGQARVQEVQPFCAVRAVGRSELVLEVERLVAALVVVVADDVVRAGDHAAGAAGAEPRGDDLVVELLPLGGPAAARRGTTAWSPAARSASPSRSRSWRASYGPVAGVTSPNPPAPHRLTDGQRERYARRPGRDPRPSGWVADHEGENRCTAVRSSRIRRAVAGDRGGRGAIAGGRRVLRVAEPHPLREAGVHRGRRAHRGIAYRTTTDYQGNPITLQLDMYEPTGDTAAKRPAIMWQFGGGWRSGHRDRC